ncbi:CHASE domain-containing protein [Undibacterium sp.]|jgi:diguanylate cyclase (GGDEF)-like protein|uniref:CHASE domain-containing protein n=1 Tax=Undibacterium sp. TaxID=1914977 RepID=UPI002BB8A4B9|nr:CHASE domain-containing protein [Undibacterium sp.]HTD04179.1 CHASE domain-containing protein [Undibacterium sp.]
MGLHRLRQYGLVLLVLSVSLAVSFLAWQHEKNNAVLDLHVSLDFNVRDVSSRIEQRMAAYEQVLHGAQGLYAVSGDIRREDFATYVNALQLGADYAGMGGIGVATIVPASQKDNHILQMRQAGFAGYDIKAEGLHAMYVPVLQLEPFVGRNLATLGLDLYSDARQRAAMDRARDSGNAAISSKLVLAAEKNRAGDADTAEFLMYLPIYAAGTASDTPAARLTNIRGWVFAPFRVKDMMASLYGESQAATDVRIYDGVDTGADSLMYDSAPHSRAKPGSKDASSRDTQRIVATEYITNGGHTWTIVIGTLPGYDEQVGKDKSRLIAATGVVLSLLLTMLTWQLATGRERALALARDMTRELRASEARFRYLAQYDELTGLPNRAMFKDRLHHAILQAKRDKTRLALMYLDLDNFKPVNDSLGHHVGDMLLSAVAERMLACVRESDTVARIGGDEFVVLLPVIEHEQDALLVAEKIRHALNQPFEVAGGHVLEVSSSTGVVLYPEHGMDEVALSRNADNAMYKAKELGRNMVRLYQPP